MILIEVITRVHISSYRFSGNGVNIPRRSITVPSWMLRWLDPTGRNDQGGEENGYLRSLSAKIVETFSLAAFGRSDSEDL